MASSDEQDLMVMIVNVQKTRNRTDLNTITISEQSTTVIKSPSVEIIQDFLRPIPVISNDIVADTRVRRSSSSDDDAVRVWVRDPA